jgi:hypothetical protein
MSYSGAIGSTLRAIGLLRECGLVLAFVDGAEREIAANILGGSLDQLLRDLLRAVDTVEIQSGEGVSYVELPFAARQLGAVVRRRTCRVARPERSSVVGLELERVT